MFISKGNLLTKKVNGKNISVKIFDDKGITKSIFELTKKELINIVKTKEYTNFIDFTFSKKYLDEIIFLSKYFVNLENFNEFNLEKSLFIEKFVYESNRTEGSKISEEEILKIFQNKKSNHINKNEIKEVENSKNVFSFMNEKFIFNIENIKKVYHILTKDLYQQTGDKYPRGFKKHINTVNNDITTLPDKVEEEITNLIKWYKNNKKEIFSLKLAFDFHLKFQKIHPFIDGNGRIGRFLLNKILMQNGFFPIIIFSENRKAFFNSIKNPGINNKKYYTFMIEQYKKTLNYFKNQ